MTEPQDTNLDAVDVQEEPLSPEEWSLIAAMWELLAFSFRYPTKDLTEAVSSGEWSEAADEIAQLVGADFVSNDEDTEEHKGADPEVLIHTLRAEATRLFIGAPKAAVSPYEGIWRAEDDGVQALLFVNPHSMDVERFMKSCGLGRPEGTNEPLDHAATEFELLEYLASLAAGAEPLEGALPADKLPGGSPESAYDQFMFKRVLVWMPRFAKKVAEESRIAFFRQAGRFASACLDTVL